jgi:hypothetical protein
VSVRVIVAYSSQPPDGYRVLAFAPSATCRQAKLLAE